MLKVDSERKEISLSHSNKLKGRKESAHGIVHRIGLRMGEDSDELQNGREKRCEEGGENPVQSR